MTIEPTDDFQLWLLGGSAAEAAAERSGVRTESKGTLTLLRSGAPALALPEWLPAGATTVEYRAVAAVAAVVRALPPRASGWLGAAIGYAFYVLDAPHRRLALDNLAAAFPSTSRRRELRAIARGVFAHFGCLLTELLRFSGLDRDADAGVGRVRGRASGCAQALAQGKGVLFITGHFGFWELQALAHALRFPPVAWSCARSTTRG